MSRLDKELTTRGLVTSRTRAGQLIEAGAVTVDGTVTTKPAARVQAHQQLAVSDTEQWVSRAAHKLLSALEVFDHIPLAASRCLDAGASTGGFTQVLLSRGATEVTAVDVGHGQLAPQIRDHPRVINREGINLRYIQPGDLGEPFDVIVADLSFISLRLVLPSLADQAKPGADLMLMVKPQFEVGKDNLSRTGVVTSTQLRKKAVEGVITAALQTGLEMVDVARSGLSGQDGNVEFFLHLRKPSSMSVPGSSLETPETAEQDHYRVSLEKIEFGDAVR